MKHCEQKFLIMLHFVLPPPSVYLQSWYTTTNCCGWTVVLYWNSTVSCGQKKSSHLPFCTLCNWAVYVPCFWNFVLNIFEYVDLMGGQSYRMSLMWVICTPWKVLVSDQSNKDEMYGTCSPHGREKKVCIILVRKPEEERLL